jgi:hypothetical protein
LVLTSPKPGVGLAPLLAAATSGRSFAASVPASDSVRFRHETTISAIVSRQNVRRHVFIKWVYEGNLGRCYAFGASLFAASETIFLNASVEAFTTAFGPVILMKTFPVALSRIAPQRA